MSLNLGRFLIALSLLSLAAVALAPTATAYRNRYFESPYLPGVQCEAGSETVCEVCPGLADYGLIPLIWTYGKTGAAVGTGLGYGAYAYYGSC